MPRKAKKSKPDDGRADSSAADREKQLLELQRRLSNLQAAFAATPSDEKNDQEIAELGRRLSDLEEAAAQEKKPQLSIQREEEPPKTRVTFVVCMADDVARLVHLFSSFSTSSEKSSRFEGMHPKVVLFRGTRDLVGKTRSTPHGGVDLLAYKIVSVVVSERSPRLPQNRPPSKRGREREEEEEDEKEKRVMVLSKISALLTLQLPCDRSSIFYTDQPRKSGLVAMRDLLPNEKYCTNLCRVIGVQFLGDPEQCKQALLAYASGHAFFAAYYGNMSDVSKMFLYELGQQSIEPRAGQQCGSGSCGSGIYFFLDANEALRYWSQRNFGAKHARDAPVITRKILESEYRELQASKPAGGGAEKVCSDPEEHDEADLESETSRLTVAEKQKHRERLEEWLHKNLKLSPDECDIFFSSSSSTPPPPGEKAETEAQFVETFSLLLKNRSSFPLSSAKNNVSK